MATEEASTLDAELLSLAKECRVPQEYHEIFQGFDVPLFGCLVSEASQLDTALAQLLENSEEPDSAAGKLRLLSSLRLLFESCKKQSLASPTNKRSDSSEEAHSSTVGWTEQFPPKLSGEKVISLQKSFHSRYPGEVLDPENFPSSRLLAYAAKVVQKGELKWVPWKIRMCQSQQDSLAMRRPTKTPKLEDLLYDEVPQREIPSGQVGANYLSGIMGLLSTSLAMLNGAHLSVLRKFERKFIRLATQKMESGLRNPSGEELMMADRQLWSQISDLVNLHNWSLDDALTEFTEVRGDMASLLQPRMAPPRRPDFPAPHLRTGRGGKGKHKGDGKGKHASGGQGNHSSTGGAKWVTKFEDKGKTRRQDSVTLGGEDAAEQFDWETCLRVLQQHCPLAAPLIRSHVPDSGRSQASYFNAGARAGSQSGICNFTFQHELLVKYVNLFLRTFFADATWTSFCISHNEFAHLHSDFNFPGSLNYTCSLGPFEKGRLWVQLPAECLPHLERVPPPDSTADTSLRGVLVSTRRSGFSFDGRIPHCSEPWSGDRWVITAYTSATWQSLSGVDFQRLTDLHFPMPGKEDSPPPLSLDPAPSLPSPPEILDLQQVQGNLFVELFSGPGPKPLRTPAHMSGVPGLSSEEKARLDLSSQLMSRAVELAHATFKAGGHYTLENPANSMIWDEPAVRLLLQKSSADVIIVSACAYGWDIYKRWAFASTFRDMQQLAADCRHPDGSHAQVAGILDPSGGFVSQQTSEFPEPLAAKFVSSALPLFRRSENPVDVALDQLLQLLPTKGQFDPPFAHQDGAGIFSVPDWSFPPSGAVDRLGQVRQALMSKLFAMKAPLRLREHVASKAEHSLFSDKEISEFRAVFQEFLEASSGQKVDWSVKPHQPYALQALRLLSEVLEDPDASLFPTLLEGVPLSGFLVRTWHSLLWLSHFLSMYVDDLILAMQTGALDISACLILAFAAVFGVTATKKEKLASVLRPLLGEGRVELRDLQKALGLLQWLTQLHVELRPWLSVLYDDATRPPATSYSVDPAYWSQLH
ncbi:unnamed protein product, partial [Symbiodinium microadriaticum]